MHDYIVSLKFEANPTIRAKTEEEALEIAQRMIDKRKVVGEDGKEDESYWAMEPEVIETDPVY